MENLSESLNRTLKLALDSGEAASIKEAEKIFSGYKLSIEVGTNVGESPTLQAAVLTAVNTARRCFLGGVYVIGKVDIALQVPWRRFQKLSEAILDLRGEVVDHPPEGAPRLIIGEVLSPKGISEFVIQVTFDGWSGGVIPFDDHRRLPEKSEFVPAGVLAGALGVSEAFQHVRGDNQMAGRREVGLSLWNSSAGPAWCSPENSGPIVTDLPSKLWILGLGHLGQAFLWTLGLLPYEKPEDVLLVLQDFDTLAKANDSTSLLTFSPVPKIMKSRLLGAWCEERGFVSRLVERRFTKDFKVLKDEPMVGICGFDNALARTALEDVGFSRIIEAGLGKDENEYLSFQIHTFPGPQSAKKRWGDPISNHSHSVVDNPAYKNLAQNGMDKCGITMLAGRTVGASFVGTVAATLMVAELLKMIHGGSNCAIIDGTLRSIDSLAAVENEQWKVPFNPGITSVRGRS